VLARLGRLLQQADFLSTLRAAETSDRAHEIIVAADREIG
jgi:mannitol/fructose-specific phosphotransferase system IIA component (Ntr-type)